MFWIVLGAVSLGLAPIFVKLIQMSSSMIGFYRSSIALMVLLPWSVLILRGRRIIFRPRAVWLLLLGGFFLTLDLFAWQLSVHWAGAGLGTLFANTQVFYVAIFGILFLKEKGSPRLFLSILLAVIGLYLLVDAGSVAHHQARYLPGVCFGLAAGLLYGLFLLCLKTAERAQPELSPVVRVAILSVVCSVGFAILAPLERGFAVPTPRDWLWLVLLALLVQILAWKLIAEHIPKVPIAKAGLLLLLQPVFAMLLGWWIFGETLDAAQILGAILTVGAIYAGSVKKVVAT